MSILLHLSVQCLKDQIFQYDQHYSIALHLSLTTIFHILLIRRTNTLLFPLRYGCRLRCLHPPGCLTPLLPLLPSPLPLCLPTPPSVLSSRVIVMLPHATPVILYATHAHTHKNTLSLSHSHAHIFITHKPTHTYSHTLTRSHSLFYLGFLFDQAQTSLSSLSQSNLPFFYPQPPFSFCLFHFSLHHFISFSLLSLSLSLFITLFFLPSLSFPEICRFYRSSANNAQLDEWSFPILDSPVPKDYAKVKRRPKHTHTPTVLMHCRALACIPMAQTGGKRVDIALASASQRPLGEAMVVLPAQQATDKVPSLVPYFEHKS